MAQAHSEDKHNKLLHETLELSSGTEDFKFNAQAPEFVPRSHTQIPVPSYYYPCANFLGGSGGGPDWFYLGDLDPFHLISGLSFAIPNCSKNFLADDLRQRIVKQVKYQLSDMSLLANDSLMKHMNKDPDGYVPIPVIASSKKSKSLSSYNHHLLVQALKYSSKLSQTVVAENLPEDHTHQNIEKIFSAVGRVKTIRIWHPQESNSSCPKGDYFIGNKLHALMEYESTEKLKTQTPYGFYHSNVQPKSVLKTRKSDFDGILDDDVALSPESTDDSAHPHNVEFATGSNAEENSAASEKVWAHGRGKPQLCTQTSGRGLLPSVPCEAPTKQVAKGLRMPDATRGFNIRQGKPVSKPARTSPHSG